MTFNFKYHPDFEDRHAFLSASKYHWLNYTDERLLEAFDKSQDAAMGTRLHKLAAELIALGIKLPNTSQTLNLYVNDCIGYFMQTEKLLFYSRRAFGTADAIDYDPEKRVLKIFDLKTGISKASVLQLELYAAYFCLEYAVRPTDIEFDLRLYQNDDVQRFETNAEDIIYVMSRVVDANRLLDDAEGV